MAKKRKKKKSKKLWGLIPYTFPWSVREYIDQNYIEKLSLEEKQWLSKFNEEYYGNTIKKDGLHYKKAKTKDKRTKEYKEEAKMIRREMYSKTNQRNRDVFTKGPKFTLGYDTLTTYSSQDLEQYALEDSLIDMIDQKKKKKKEDDNE